MEIFAGIAVAIILWMVWQLYRAKRFTQFKHYINKELKPLVIEKLKQRLAEQQSDLFPNNEAHIEASIYYWCQYPSRILQAAIAWNVISLSWLDKTGNTRNCQHLFFLEKDKLANIKEEEEDSNNN